MCICGCACACACAEHRRTPVDDVGLARVVVRQLSAPAARVERVLGEAVAKEHDALALRHPLCRRRHRGGAVPAADHLWPPHTQPRRLEGAQRGVTGGLCDRFARRDRHCSLRWPSSSHVDEC
eukprot:360633-Chlamydomonas_euryale.AAC.15